MVPVGLLPPLRVAVSVTWPPSTTPGEAVVTRLGTAGPAWGVTTTVSAGSLQAVVTGLLSTSPL
jgi:hypothetical protein